MTTLPSGLARLALAAHGAIATPRLSILIFHRVHATRDTLFPHEPDAARFEQLMRFVAGAFTVLPLGRAAALLGEKRLPARALTITFDDGYADNAEVALPILRRLGLPATFFVATGFLDGGRMWNDTVIECIRACRESEIDLGEFGLGRRPLTDPARRVAAIEALLGKIKYLTLAEREAALQRLQGLVGDAALPSNLMMRSEQVREMHRAGMEIGAHTVRHPILTRLTPQEAEAEITEGRQRLESIIDAPVDTLAYPNGKPGQDYDHAHVELVRRLGFKAAVSTAPGVAQAGDDLFQLPRYTPWGSSLAAWGGRLILNRRHTRFATASPTDGAASRP